MTIAAVARGESAGTTGEVESWHRRRGERRHYRRKIARITSGGEDQYYRRGRRLAGPERVSAGVSGGESAAVTGEARGGVIREAGGGVAGGVERRHYRRGRLQGWLEEESANASAFPSRNTCTLLIW